MPSFGFLYAGEVWVLLENQMMLLAVFERAALMLMTLFFLTRTRPFQRLFQKRDHTRPSWCWSPPSSACSPCSVPTPAFR